MPTNKPGYIHQYFARERARIIKRLGGRCAQCGSIGELQIHHREPLNGNRPKGELNRLTEWKRHPENLQLLCASCHLDAHNGIRKWWKYLEVKKENAV